MACERKYVSATTTARNFRQQTTERMEFAAIALERELNGDIIQFVSVKLVGIGP